MFATRAVGRNRARDWRSDVTVWTILGAMAAIDAIWGNCVGMSFHGVGTPVLAAAGLMGIAMCYRRRSPNIASTAESGALWITFAMTGCILTYLCASAGKPLQDDWLAEFDGAIGFNWRAWHDLLANHPLLNAVLAVAYASLMPQILFAVIYLPVAGRADRSRVLLLTAIVSLVPSAIVSGIWPALGPAPDGFSYVPDVMKLRARGPWDFDLSTMQGIITLPSYHTTLAVLFTYAFRRIGPIGLAIAALNVVMLPSIPPFGDHYLMDVLMGATIAAFGIVLTSLGTLLLRHMFHPVQSELPLAGGRPVSPPLLT